MSQERRVEALERVVLDDQDEEDVVIVWPDDPRYGESLARAVRLSGRGVWEQLRLVWPNGDEVSLP